MTFLSACKLLITNIFNTFLKTLHLHLHTRFCSRLAALTNTIVILTHTHTHTHTVQSSTVQYRGVPDRKRHHAELEVKGGSPHVELIYSQREEIRNNRRSK